MPDKHSTSAPPTEWHASAISGRAGSVSLLLAIFTCLDSALCWCSFDLCSSASSLNSLCSSSSFLLLLLLLLLILGGHLGSRDGFCFTLCTFTRPEQPFKTKAERGAQDQLQTCSVPMNLVASSRGLCETTFHVKSQCLFINEEKYSEWMICCCATFKPCLQRGAQNK